MAVEYFGLNPCSHNSCKTLRNILFLSNKQHTLFGQPFVCIGSFWPVLDIFPLFCRRFDTRRFCLSPYWSAAVLVSSFSLYPFWSVAVLTIDPVGAKVNSPNIMEVYMYIYLYIRSKGFTKTKCPPNVGV